MLFLQSGWRVQRTTLEGFGRWCISQHVTDDIKCEFRLGFLPWIVHSVDQESLNFGQMEQMKAAPLPPLPGFSVEGVVLYVLVKLVYSIHVVVVQVYKPRNHDGLICGPVLLSTVNQSACVSVLHEDSSVTTFLLYFTTCRLALVSDGSSSLGVMSRFISAT